MARKVKPQPLPPRVDDVVGQDEEYWKKLRARLPERDRRNVDGLTKLKSVYVDCGRDDVLRRSFDFFLQDFLSTKDGRRTEADVFFVTGESGAGKSEAVHRLLSNHPALQPLEMQFGKIKPYVSVKLSGFTHPRLAGRRIIAEAGYPIRHDTERGEIWDTMATRLRSRGTFLVHIDETQHLIARNAGERERQQLADAIKGVSIDGSWPVAFVLSGLPSVADMPFYDEQFERRGRFVEFTDLQMPDELRLVQTIVRRLSDAVEVACEDLLKSDIPHRLARAANFRYGRVCKAVASALHEALDEGTHVLTRGHFAEAYVKHSHAFGADSANPFLADRWEDLPPGSFIIRGENFVG